MEARRPFPHGDMIAALRGPNRCDACLTEQARSALEFLMSRHPGMDLSEEGWCDVCGGAGRVVDLPLMLSLSRRGILRVEDDLDRPRHRLRARDWFAPEKKPLSIHGIIASLAEPAPGGIAAILEIGRR